MILLGTDALRLTRTVNLGQQVLEWRRRVSTSKRAAASKMVNWACRAFAPRPQLALVRRLGSGANVGEDGPS